MKKSLAAAALAGILVLTAAGTVFAADPVQFNGKIQYQHRINSTDGTDSNENRLKFILNGKADTFADNMKIYFRISAETINGGKYQTAADFDQSVPGQDGTVTSVAGLFDQFGVVINNAGWNYKVGRQDAFIGANGLIYDSTYGVAKHIFADGITVTGKSGVTNISAVALQLDKYGDIDPKVYAIAASYNPSKDLTLGTTLVKFNGDNLQANKRFWDKNFWDVNVAYTFTSKLDGYAEYAKSNASSDNKSYVYGINYSLDNKNSFWTCYSHVEFLGQIHDGMSTSTYDSNREGMWYGFGHKFDKTTTLNLYYSNMKKINANYGPGGNDFTSFRTTVNYKF